MKNLVLAILLFGTALPTAADFVIDVNLGVLPIGDTPVAGDTTGGPDNSIYVRGIDLNPFANWGNERVYQFQVQQPSIVSITSTSTFTGDPDFFLLSSLRTSIDPFSGKPSGEDGLDLAYLDGVAPETVDFVPILPGTYYLLVESFDGFDGGVVPGDAVFSVTLSVQEDTIPVDFTIDLGHIVQSDTPFSIDTFGSTFDTKLALYDVFGGLLEVNADAGGGVQSQLDFPTGLPEGGYYVAIGGGDVTFENSFVMSTGGLTGDWTLNYPLGPVFGPGQDTGTTDSSFLATEGQFFFFQVNDPPAVFTDLGAIAGEDEPFSIDTIGSFFDTIIGLFDSEGFVLVINDDIDFNGGNFLSELNFVQGLPEGEYFLALAGYPSIFEDGYFVGVDGRIAGSSEGGNYFLNHPLGTEGSAIAVSGQAWFQFTISPVAPVTIEVTEIGFNKASNEFTISWNSSAAGPFDIWIGTAADLAGLSAPPNNLLPTSAALGVTSPFTFTVPAALQGQPSLFLQVTD